MSRASEPTRKTLGMEGSSNVSSSANRLLGEVSYDVSVNLMMTVVC